MCLSSPHSSLISRQSSASEEDRKDYNNMTSAELSWSRFITEVYSGSALGQQMVQNFVGSHGSDRMLKNVLRVVICHLKLKLPK